MRLIDALDQLARRLVAELDADACVVSRVLGDVLIMVTQFATVGTILNLGQGFLVSDYPLTAEVLRSGEPARLTLGDPAVDAAEAELLRELGYSALLMVPLRVAGEQWGLAEAYRKDTRAFGDADCATATRLAQIG